ncbi:NAD+ diphosphatase [Geosmithia morbida]|uniref:NAD(+) diphosphatase n=1 Tax=Geosmithia morbida TaxID=1094350 RepID=A0A9P4YW99_9HYPO|nr:NAD+ diphosphatase [Geosmithia morbida]KAF4123190.1 NAD+ diphosphatase [Geosmithia morbida]
MSNLPLMPEVPFLANDESMLTRRFGKEVVNYYSGSTLNRYSFLRSDSVFLSGAVRSPAARFVVLHTLNPLAVDRTRLAHLELSDVRALIGPNPFSLTEEESDRQFDSSKRSPLVVFLGLFAGQGSSTDDIPTADHGVVRGDPFFAIDATPRPPYEDAANALIESQEEKGNTIQTNPRAMSLNSEAAAMYAQSRSMIDWNNRNSFCAGCGNPTKPSQAGYKRVCPPRDAAASPPERPDCPTRHGVSNLCFPRTDPTMIAAVVSADGQRVLLGRSPRFPPDWYSTLAGFLEPGESMEEAVRREVWEEAGVRVGRVVIHSTQPWPYPASLMIGAIAQALPGGEDINLNDRELEDAKWYTMDELRKALGDRSWPLGQHAPRQHVPGELGLPPSQAIANQLLTAVANGFLTTIPKM